MGVSNEVVLDGVQVTMAARSDSSFAFLSASLQRRIPFTFRSLYMTSIGANDAVSSHTATLPLSSILDADRFVCEICGPAITTARKRMMYPACGIIFSPLNAQLCIIKTG